MKSEKIAPSFGGLDPDAGVGDREAHHARPGAVFGGHGQLDRAQFSKFDRVTDQVHQHLAEPERIAHQPQRGAGRNPRDQFQPLAVRAHGQRFDRRFDQVAEVEFNFFHLYAPALDLGQVEDIVKQGHQRAAIETHDLEIAALVRVEAGFRQHFGHAEDGIHRGANLVRHAGEELGLRVRGDERLLARRYQRLIAFVETAAIESGQMSRQLSYYDRGQ